MKLISILFIVCLIAGCGTTKNTGFMSGQLDGTWIPVKEELGGTSFPAASFALQRLIIDGKNYTFVAESVDKGELTYADGKMDIYGKEGINAGKHFKAIYKYINGELTICYNLSGDAYPDSFETKSNPTLFLAVFKKI